MSVRSPNKTDASKKGVPELRDVVMTAEEFVNLPLPPRETGNWKYRPENLTLYNEEADYEVDLERITTSAAALDWILQIAEKWDEEKFDLPGFVNALKEAVDHNFGQAAQAVLCPFGQSMVIDWRRRKAQRA